MKKASKLFEFIQKLIWKFIGFGIVLKCRASTLVERDRGEGKVL